MFEEIKKKLIKNNEEYLILQNGINFDSSKGVENLNFSKDVNLKVIHIIDSDTILNYIVNNNLDVTVNEIFYSINNHSKVTINILVKKNAKFNYLSCKTSKLDTNVVINVNTFLEEGSYFNNKNLSFLASNCIINDNVYLNEVNSEANIKSLIVNTTSKEQNFKTEVYHNVDKTKSEFKNYGICHNSSLLNLNSNGIIKSGAKKVELRQKAKGLLLDLNSKISANPLLEINDYDCIASHGASIGAIDEEELYYLMSRGLTKTEAERLIVSSLFSPILEEVNDDKLHDYFNSLISLSI